MSVPVSAQTVVVLSESGDEALQSRLEALDRSFTFPSSALAVQVSTARAGLSYRPEARATLHASRPLRGQEESSCHAARYQVFRDLRGRGFYLTSAGKFGGHFLVYPGDYGALKETFVNTNNKNKYKYLFTFSC